MCKGCYFVPRDPTESIKEIEGPDCKHCGKCRAAQLSFDFDVAGTQPVRSKASEQAKLGVHDVKDSIKDTEDFDPLGR